MAQASKGYWAISKEVTPGTAITTPSAYYPVIEANADYENEFVDVMEIRGSRQAYRALDGRVAPTASVKGLIYPSKALALILKGLVGSVSSAAAGASTTAYRHDFADAASLPYFTFERADARSGEGGLLCERVAGAKVESFSLNASFGEEVTFEAQFQALKKPATATPVAAGSIVYPTMDPMVFLGAAVEIGGVANSEFKSLQLEITNTLERQEALNGTQEAYKIFEGGVECTLSGTMVFDSLTMYNRLIQNTEFDMDLTLTGGIADAVTTPDTMYTLGFGWPKVRVAKYSVPFTAGEVIEADVDFRIIYSQDDDASFTCYMINTEDGTGYV
jgi:hypothetical protein